MAGRLRRVLVNRPGERFGAAHETEGAFYDEAVDLGARPGAARRARGGARGLGRGRRAARRARPGPDSIYTYDPALVCRRRRGPAALRASRSGSPRRPPWASGSSATAFPCSPASRPRRWPTAATCSGSTRARSSIGRGLPHERRRCLRDHERGRALRRCRARRRPAVRPGQRLLPAHAQRDLDARPRPGRRLAAADARAPLPAAARARCRADRDRRAASGTRSRRTCSRSARATSSCSPAIRVPPRSCARRAAACRKSRDRTSRSRAPAGRPASRCPCNEMLYLAIPGAGSVRFPQNGY